MVGAANALKVFFCIGDNSRRTLRCGKLSSKSQNPFVVDGVYVWSRTTHLRQPERCTNATGILLSITTKVETSLVGANDFEFSIPLHGNSIFAHASVDRRHCFGESSSGTRTFFKTVATAVSLVRCLK